MEYHGLIVRLLAKQKTENSFINSSEKCYIMSQDGTRIPISKKTREELKSLGSKGDTYDDIIKNLLQDTDNTCMEESE